MKEHTIYFDILPRVVPANRKTIIYVKPLYDHRKVKTGAEYEVIHSPMETKGTWAPGTPEKRMQIIPVNACFQISLTFEGEQEHMLEITEIVDGERRKYCIFSVYSLERDLYVRRPYKGDMHMHSYYSDGYEPPAYIAGACRRIGLDFMAVTDHEQYQPSIEAQKAFENIDIDLKIFNGEEVQPPGNSIHMINFGGKFGINELFNKESEKYHMEIEQIMKETHADLTEHNKYQYASCVWCFNKIHEAGGLGIYCHPYWVYNKRYNVPKPLHDYIHEMQPFDACEIVGGFKLHEVESNILQVAYYQEQRSKGKAVPIVGVSDAHSCEAGWLFGWYYTIVFSPELELQYLIESIKDTYSVAVEALPGETVRVYGPYRLVKYALFLLREIFPVHDALCFEEGKLMLEYVSGNKEAAAALKSVKGRTVQQMNKCWG